MKKNYFKSVLCVTTVTLAIVGGIKSYELIFSSMPSEIILANVEALTREENEKKGYFVHHFPYINPVTNLITDKCIATSYQGPNGPCTSSHKHNADTCCHNPC